MNKKRVFLTSTGCYIVQIETNLIAAYLKKNGYQLVDSTDTAHAIIVTTCAVTQASANVTYQRILQLIEKKEESTPLYIVGCFTRIELKKMEELLQFDNVFSIPEIRDIEKEFPGEYSLSFIIYNDFFSHPFATDRLIDYNKKIFFKTKIIKNTFALIDTVLKTEIQFRYLFQNGHLYCPHVQRAIWPVLIAKGCVYKCTYCVVRKGRGKYTSKPIDLVLKEIETGIQKKYKRVLLIGDELGTYGIDLKDGSSLSSLLEKFLLEKYPIKLGIWYLDAFRLKNVASVLEKLAEKDKIFFLGITVQTGSKRILKLMNRHYSIKDTMDVILKLRKYPSIIIATQFMVGFPTETEEDFQETLALVKKGCFDNVEVYCYSPRPGTPAAKMLDDVPLHVKEERAKRLRTLAGKKSRRLLINYILHEIKHAFL